MRSVCVFNGQRGVGKVQETLGYNKNLISSHCTNFHNKPALLHNTQIMEYTHPISLWFIHSKVKTNMKMQTLVRLLLKCQDLHLWRGDRNANRRKKLILSWIRACWTKTAALAQCWKRCEKRKMNEHRRRLRLRTRQHGLLWGSQPENKSLGRCTRCRNIKRVQGKSTPGSSKLYSACLSPVSQGLHTLIISTSECFQTRVMTDVARGRTEMAAEESGGHSLGPALCAFPADKASKYGCIHESLNTHTLYTHIPGRYSFLIKD